MTTEIRNGTDVAESAANLVELIPATLPTVPEDVEAEVARAREQAESIVIDSEESAKAALELVKVVKRRAKEIKDERMSLTKPRKDAAEEIKRIYDRMEAPFKEVEGVLQSAIGEWQRAKEEEARERQRQIDEERQRVEAEARAKREAAEKAVREAEELAEEATNDDDVAVAGALSEEARRDAERAGVTEQAIGSLPPQAPPVPPKLDGFSTPKRWVAEVVDFNALPDRLPDGTPLKVVDEVALRRWMLDQVKANGNVAPDLPGAKFERVSGESVRA